jgi:hypothetical protein
VRAWPGADRATVEVAYVYGGSAAVAEGVVTAIDEALRDPAAQVSARRRCCG